MMKSSLDFECIRFSMTRSRTKFHLNVAMKSGINGARSAVQITKHTARYYGVLCGCV